MLSIAKLTLLDEVAALSAQPTFEVGSKTHGQNVVFKNSTFGGHLVRTLRRTSLTSREKDCS